MASTYSPNLAIELIGSGEQSGTWGTTTNTNLGTLLEQAISGVTTTACTGGTDTITIPNGASGTARNMFLELTGTGGGSLVVPANKKLYFIYNNTSLAITVKVTGQTGVSVPAAAKTILVMNSAGTDVVNATNYFSALTLGAALPVASGGTGFTSTTAYSVYTGNSAGTGFTAIANGTTGQILQATTSGAPVWGSTYAGTVTSVAALTLGTTGTDLSSTVATGTTTPVITLQVPTASAANRGALSSTDWSTFNGKQAALVSGTNIKTVNSTTLLGAGDVSVGVTSVTGTAPVVSSGGATPAISMAAATTSVNGYLTSTDWTTFNSKQAALVSGTNIKTVNSTSLLGSGDVSVGVTSVTGTAPVVSSGGATPAISMPVATSLANGYLSSTDWTTFNNKGSGTVTSVTGTAPVVSSGGATPAISMAAASTSVSGYLTSTDWNTFNGKQAAGSYVTVGGALGTPSSGTLTNCTFPTLNQNTSGTAAGLSSTLAVSSGGTGTTSATAYAVQCGGTTSTGAHQSVASVGTSGQVLTSNGAGALPTFQTVSSYAGTRGQSFTTGGTFTIPTGITTLKVTVQGGGGNGASSASRGGSSGATAIVYLTGLTPGNTIGVTVAAVAGNSSIQSGTQAITTVTANGNGGSATNGTINISGVVGGYYSYDSANYTGGTGGSSIFGGAGAGGNTSGTGYAATGYGSGGGGGGGASGCGIVWASGGSGAQGIVIFEY